jgi:thiol-disulfide isomerase/thioredoxin
MKKLKIATILICLLWVLSSCSTPSPSKSETQTSSENQPSPTPALEETPDIDATPETTPLVEAPEIGKLAPNFQFNDAHKQTVFLADFKGKPVLLNFWATWCFPCRAEMPYIQNVYDTWSEHGLVILAVNMGESPSKVEEFMKSNNFSFPVILDGKRSLADKYNIRYVPTTYFIDSNGVIRDIKIGAFRSVAEIEDMANSILP